MTIVFDLDGVVYLGNDVVPGALEVLEWCRRSGIQPLFVTNNSVRTPTEVVAKIRDVVGFDVTVDEVITSALAAADLVAERAGRSCLVVGERGIVEALAGRGVHVVEDPHEADHVVVGLTRSISYELLADATTAVLQGAALVATNLDPTFPTPTGLRPGAGSLVAAIETASGTDAIPAGKPFAPIRSLITAQASGKVVVVGDRPDTDIALGITEGWPTLLCLTGVTADASQVPGRYQPTRVIASIADVPEAVRSLDV